MKRRIIIFIFIFYNLSIYSQDTIYWQNYNITCDSLLIFNHVTLPIKIENVKVNDCNIIPEYACIKIISTKEIDIKSNSSFYGDFVIDFLVQETQNKDSVSPIEERLFYTLFEKPNNIPLPILSQDILFIIHDADNYNDTPMEIVIYDDIGNIFQQTISFLQFQNKLELNNIQKDILYLMEVKFSDKKMYLRFIYE